MGGNMMSGKMMDGIGMGYRFSFGCYNNTKSENDSLNTLVKKDEDRNYGKIIFLKCVYLPPRNYIPRTLARGAISLIPFIILFSLITPFSVSSISGAPHGATSD